ncbi:BMP family ABC transporter substrate-binding protein, partial [Aduncisulcus paluster]
FKEKWIALCEAHLEEGIRDPIKVYEFMNWFYVLEGNKRVSVLKYFDAWSVQAEVIRLVPKRDTEDDQNTIYYEFLEFYKVTGLISIWFSKPGRFKRLLKYLESYTPETSIGRTKYDHFERYVYYPFRRIYHELGGGDLDVTTGDAFVLYARLYGIPEKIYEYDLQAPLRQLIEELKTYDQPDKAGISMEDSEESTGVL